MVFLVGCAQKVDAPVTTTGAPTTPGGGTPGGLVTGVLPTVPALGLPEGMLAYFDDYDCPAGWSEWQPGVGRTLVAVTNSADVGVTVGDALDSATPRPHVHGLEATFDLPGVGVAGLSSCCNGSPGASGPQTAIGDTGETASTLPTLALRICRLDEGSDAGGVSLPDGVTAFFDRDVCPDGMARPAESTGRMVLATTNTSNVGLVSGSQLAPGELRTHTHDAVVDVSIPDVSLVGVGGSNNDFTRDGAHQGSGTTAEAELGLPYAQALLCEVTQAATPTGTDDTPLTAGAIVFSTDACPSGWAEHQQLTGRFAVGSPYGVFSGTTSGDPLTDLDQPTHTHDVAIDLTVPSREVALASGCCFGGTGQNGTYAVTGATDPSPVDVPYIHLRPCRSAAP